MIKIQKNNFDIEKEVNQIKRSKPNIGAVSIFSGYVRKINNKKKVTLIKLEVYEKMAHKTLEKICKKAKSKWNLIDILVIHRFGNLKVNEKIVLVATFSKHRKDSYESCNFIMNFLKKEAPFWKKEYYKDKFKWIENSKS